jgi:hypothetical protein
MCATASGTLDASAQDYYRRSLDLLGAAGVPYLIGGAYALAHYTGVTRHTKDLDLFLRRADVPAARAAFERAGYRTELTYDHWLAKAFANGHFVDLIFNLGNGASPVDDAWFDHATAGELLGVPVRLVGPEEMIVSKVFVLDRGRYDGADVAHLLRAAGGRLDWPRLLGYFDQHWRVLLSHLVLFGFVYPADRGRVPAWVLRTLLDRLQAELTAGPAEPVCRGTLFSPTQYRIDVEEWGYADARLRPWGDLTPAQVDEWTAGVLAGK